ncbi:MAG: hypothetical protein ACYS5W_17215 [Planctomycetota bacterium]
MVNQHLRLRAVLGCLLVMAAALPGQQRENQPVKHSGLAVGSGAPELRVQEWLRGDPVKLPGRGHQHQHQQSVLLLVFCSTADKQAPQLLVSLGRTQEKHREAGVRIVAIPVEDAGGVDPKALLEQEGNHEDDAVVALARDKAGATARAYLGKQTDKLPRAFLINHFGLITWIGHPRRGLYDPLHQAMAIAKDRELLAKLRATRTALGQAQAKRDWKTMMAITQDLIAIGARNSAPWIQRFRSYRDYGKKDLQKARETAVAALKDLTLRPNQLVEFANQCLLRYADNLYYHQITLMALTPAAAQEPTNVRVQIAYARALAGCGNVKQAAAVAGRIVPLLGDNPKELQRYAQQLSNSRQPHTFGGTALAAVDRAIALKGVSRDLLMIKFRILDVCMKDHQAAHKVGEQIIAAMANNNSSLNTFAWDLLTEEPHKGRFSKLALLAAEAMEKNGQGVSYYMLDTIALAKFENGFIDEAIAYQKRAIAGGGKGDSDYDRRMEMYKQARRARDKNKAKSKKQ